MDRGTILQALSTMEQFIVRLREQDDELKRQVNAFQAEIQQLKQEMQRVQLIERDQNRPEADRLIARADEARCKNAVSERENALRESERQVVDLASQVQTSQHIIDELKTAEGYMRDYERRAQRWVNEAYNMMR